jgi:hypothetical protein
MFEYLILFNKRSYLKKNNNNNCSVIYDFHKILKLHLFDFLQNY